MQMPEKIDIFSNATATRFVCYRPFQEKVILDEVMKLDLTRRTVLLHGGREVHILTPRRISPYICAFGWQGYYSVFANSSGNAVLKELLTIACALRKDELIHLPLSFPYYAEFIKDFWEPSEHLTNLIFMNYCTCQLKTKEIVLAIKSPPCRQQVIARSFPLSDDFVKRWKKQRRLTVKTAGKTLILSTNRDVFTDMAQSCKFLSELEDNEEMNHLPPHMHYNYDENTAKSLGIVFTYWTPPLNQ